MSFKVPSHDSGGTRARFAQRVGVHLVPLPTAAFAAASQPRLPWFRFALAVSLALGSWLAASLPAQAPQARLREYPPAEYYLGFRLIEEGDFVKAGQAFRAAARGGIRTAEGAWVDGVCYHTMVGECHYQMGDLPTALDQYTSAVRLVIAHGYWMLRVNFPDAISPRLATQAVVTPWGQTTRRTAPGQFANRYPILQGRLDNQNVVQQGGVVALPEFYLINAHEITRCAALAIRRRGELLGRTSPHDPLNQQLLNLLITRPAPVNHWTQAWIDTLLGLAYSATGRQPEAASQLSKSLQIGGQIDHPLTPTALLELGKLAFRQGQYDAAATFFFEATISGAWFDQVDLMEEAFRWGTMTHLVTGPKGELAGLLPALSWAKQERTEFLEASLLIQQAQIAAELQQNLPANQLIDSARRAMLRKEMVKGAVGARFHYVAALAAFQAGNLAEGEKDWNLVAAYQTQRGGSQRLFEIGLVDALALSGKITPRVAYELYSDVLREPTKIDWATQPVETLSVTIAPHFPAHEHWLAVAAERGEHERMVEIADRIRRLRFHATVPMGGRLLSLKWVLDAAKESLPDRAALVRQDLLARYPQYGEAARRSAELRGQLLQLPLMPEDPAVAQRQQQAFTELATVSQAQELMLRSIALRREATDFTFPPVLDFKELQSRLAPQQAILAFLLTSQNQLYGFWVRNDKYSQWRVDAANRHGPKLADLLKRFGQLDRNTPVDLAALRAEPWEPAAAELWNLLTGELKPEALTGVEELIVVPDRWLWYVPFEALPAGDEASPLLIQRMAIRYVPTVSLALPDRRPANILPDIHLLASRSLPKEELSVIEETAESLRKVLGKVSRVQGPLPAPSSLCGATTRRVVVFDPIDPLQGRGLYEWAPFQLDREKPGSTLSAWFALPWGAPDELVLPNYHTLAETALKRSATGDELFLNACGLMAAGARTVLLSRWRTGGQTTMELTREFVQETPYVPASSAWQRSVLLIREKELNLAREPRIKVAPTDGTIRAAHPFFWAGYLVVDQGAVPPRDPPAAASK